MRDYGISAVFSTLIALSSLAAASDSVINVDEDHLKDYWTRTKSEGSAPALYPREAIAAGASGCVAAAFSIDANGRAGAARVIHSYITKKDGDEMRAHFERNVLANIATWRYLAATAAPQPVNTYVTAVAVAEMGLRRQGAQDEIKAHCRGTDFSHPADADAK
jgi:hypothetical protein